MPRAYVAVGSNIDPSENVVRAVCMLSRAARITGVSTVYRTAAVGGPGQPEYYNLVVEVETEMPPADLKHAVLRSIEDELGRRRGEDRHAPRTADLDLIAYGGMEVAEGDLTLPDPDIPLRPFLSIPLCELAPGLCLPGIGRMEDIAPVLPESGMEPLADFTVRLRMEVFTGPDPAVSAHAVSNGS